MKNTRRIPENQINYDEVYRRTGVNQNLTIRQRFFLYVDKTTEEKCWNWTSSLTSNHTQPVFSINGIYYNPNRLSFAMHNPDFDPVDKVKHFCNNKLCVNPYHLYVEERDFKFAKDIRDVPFYDKDNGIFLTWEKLRKLENEIIRKIYEKGKFIKKEKGISHRLHQKEIGEIFNLDYSVISHIINKDGTYGKLKE